MIPATDTDTHDIFPDDRSVFTNYTSKQPATQTCKVSHSDDNSEPAVNLHIIDCPGAQPYLQVITRSVESL
jgi:hypothetical protein